MTRRLLAIFAILGLFIGACSSSSDDSSDDTTTTEADKKDEKQADTIAFDDWVDEVNGLCADFTDFTDELNQSIDEVDPGDWETIADLLDQGQGAFEDMVGEIEDLGDPDENASEAADAIELLNDRNDLLSEAVTAAEDEDEEALADLSDELDDNQSDLNDLADELGLDDCVNEDDSGGTTDNTTDFSTDSTLGGSTGGDGDLSTIYGNAINQSLLDQGFTDEQAQCITDGVLSRFTTDELAAIDITDPAVTDAITEVTLNCI